MPGGNAYPLATKTTPGLVTLAAGVNTETPGEVSLSRPTLVLCVDSNGDDTTGDGSPTAPYRTLAKAFAIIEAAPSDYGWTVRLPGGIWAEDVAMPPADVTLEGQGVDRTVLGGVAASAIPWTESGNPGARTIRNMRIIADITGEDNGDIAFTFERCNVAGTHTNVGLAVFDGCSEYPALTNMPRVRVRNTANVHPLAFVLTYDPFAATNGSGALGSVIEGGLWSSITYSATDASSELTVLGAKVGNVVAEESAVVRVLGGTVTGNIDSNAAASLVEYDQPIRYAKPTLSGLGKFKFAELLLRKSQLAGFTGGAITVAVPSQWSSDVDLSAVFISFNKPGIRGSYVSNTASALVILVELDSSPAPAFVMSLLVRPQ